MPGFWKLLTARWGSGSGETDEVRIDASTNSLNCISYEHHEIHGGSLYTAEDNASGGSGTKATISFTTPDTTKWAHAIFTVRANVESHYTLGEGATITAASGADYVPRNQNRNSGNASALISAGSAGGAGKVTIGGTVTNFGTVLETIHFGSGKQGGEGRGMREWVLKQNTTYACEVETEAASSECTIEIHWYEHTDKH